MGPIKPFEIAVPDSKLEALNRKLEDATFPDELEDAAWDLGAPLGDVKRLVKYWRDGFDWRASEQKLNDALPQFTTDVDVEGFGSIDLHFVHQKSKVDNAIPLLFIHGCELIFRHATHGMSTDVVSRAWEFPRSQETAAIARPRRCNETSVSCGSPVPSEFWILARD